MIGPRSSALTLFAVVSLAALASSARAQDLTDRRRIEIARRLRESAVAVGNGDISGSGFIASREGWVVTNHHVAEAGRGGGLEIRLGDGRRFQARILALDPSHDLAVLEMLGTTGRIRPLALGDSDRVRIGQTVLAYGSPFGLEGTLTQGIVSARRDLPGLAGGAVHGLIQTDAPINPGNSGGPLVDSRGQVIGVNTAILSRSGGSQGIGFAVPVTYVRQLLSRVRDELASRRVAAAHPPVAPPGWPVGGIQLIPPPPTAPTSGAPHAAAWLGIFGEDFRAGSYAGVRVTRVVPGSPASRAGVLGESDPPPPYIGSLGIPWTGHIVLAVDGRPVRSMTDLAGSISTRAPGQQVVLTVTVGPGIVTGQTVVTLAPNPDAPATPPPAVRPHPRR